jgi:hypothetical protein
MAILIKKDRKDRDEKKKNTQCIMSPQMQHSVDRMCDI